MTIIYSSFVSKSLTKNVLLLYMNLIYVTGVLSLVIQIVTLIFDIYVVSMKFNPLLSFIKNLLWIEIWVQIVEGTFYLWLVTNFAKIGNVTKYRYYDWIITTPTMLFTFCMYLYYINTKDAKNTKDGRTFYEIVESNIFDLLPIFILNTSMLFFGYLAEIGKINAMTGAVFGFIPFVMFFYLIYETYAKYTNIGKITFTYFISIWSLYGFASVLSYKYKNMIYNILDLFAKNFFGLFLALVLLYNKPLHIQNADYI